MNYFIKLLDNSLKHIIVLIGKRFPKACFKLYLNSFLKLTFYSRISFLQDKRQRYICDEKMNKLSKNFPCLKRRNLTTRNNT